MTRLCLVLGRAPSAASRTIAAALAYELELLAIDAEVVIGGEVQASGIPVYIHPHEVFGDDLHESGSRDARSRGVAVLSSHPWGIDFDRDVALAETFGAVLDTSGLAVEELRRLGIDAHHLQLGYSAVWDKSAGARTPSIDVAFVGTTSHRREVALGLVTRELLAYRHEIALIQPGAADAGPADLLGDVLSRTRLLVDVHRDEPPRHSWLRSVRAICAGVPVVSEAAWDLAPLEPLRHLVVGSVVALPALVVGLLEDPDRQRRLATDALAFLREEVPLAPGAVRLAEVAESPRSEPRRRRQTADTRAGEFTVAQPTGREGGLAALRAVTKKAKIELIELRREVARLQRQLAGDGSTEVVANLSLSQRCAVAPPAISVIVTVFNYEQYVERALDSVARSTLQDIELVIVDDASNDGSADCVQRWIDNHPGTRVTLLRCVENRGVSAARNLAIGHAKGIHCFMLDADDEIYPRCLELLQRALDDSLEAWFAFGLHERYATETGEPLGLQNIFGWRPEMLARHNIIGVMALVRRDRLLELGGYSDDARLAFGWEDYDLWCRVAEAGGAGVLVPEVLARYRISDSVDSSLSSLVDLSTTDVMDALRERHPGVFAGSTD